MKGLRDPFLISQSYFQRRFLLPSLSKCKLGRDYYHKRMKLEVQEHKKPNNMIGPTFYDGENLDQFQVLEHF